MAHRVDHADDFRIQCRLAFRAAYAYTLAYRRTPLELGTREIRVDHSYRSTIAICGVEQTTTLQANPQRLEVPVADIEGARDALESVGVATQRKVAAAIRVRHGRHVRVGCLSHARQGAQIRAQRVQIAALQWRAVDPRVLRRQHRHHHGAAIETHVVAEYVVEATSEQTSANQQYGRYRQLRHHQ